MITIIDNINRIKINEKLSIALGTFDGIHYGHRKIICDAVEVAKKNGLKSAVLTFDKHPLKLIRPELDVKTLTDIDVKKEIIQSIGVDYLIIARFDVDFANIEPEKFVEILHSNLNAKAILCGFNYTFGKEGKGTPDLLDRLKTEYDYHLYVHKKIRLKDLEISSSIIRDYVSSGDIELANLLLGYKYYLLGKVVEGKKIGSKLGFPTANLTISDDIALKNGVYITNTIIDGMSHRSITNVGYAPTLEGGTRRVETFVFNFQGNLYNKDLKIEFMKFLRSEKKFSSIYELQKQVKSDIDTAMNY